MKHPRIFGLLVVAGCSCVLAEASAGQPAAEVRLVLDESSILPGAPTGLTVTVINHGEKELSLPSALWLIATPNDGKTFVVRSSTLTQESSGEEALTDAQRTLAAGATRELRYDPSVAVVGTPWFMDPNLWKPGRYTLRAVFAPALTPDGSFTTTNALASAPQTLTVAPENEDDAAVWQWMQTQKWSEGAWMDRPWQLITFITKEHPKSGYALYAALYQPVTDDRPTPAFEELLTRFARKPFTEQLKLRRIFLYQQSSYVAWRRADLFHAASDAEAARAMASELIHSSRSSGVRASAKTYLDHIPTREQLTAKQKDR
jgi:hypothetical protein